MNIMIMVNLLLLLVVLVALQSEVRAFQPSLQQRTNHHLINNKIITQQSIRYEPSRRVAITYSRYDFLFMTDDDEDDEKHRQSISLVGIAGLISQPIVWSSLYLVRTTGGGYPAGPFGLVGLLEGLSYLAVVALAATSTWKNLVTGGRFYKEYIPRSVDFAERLSVITLVVALLVLLSLVVDQGCVPNAKPILDYSDYLPICNPEDTPGFFGQ
mmetsp:Transcript_24732/g.59618  ORF Transcript_24732/g.59618 Transcript_24732/m.59618 type:complete len:213 (+) Transcript_24732:46-684(+)